PHSYSNMGSAVVPVSHVSGHHGHRGPIILPAPWVWGWGAWGPVPYMPPIVVVAPGGYFPAGPPIGPPIVAQGLAGAPQAPVPQVPMRLPVQTKAQPKRSDPTRSSQMITLGDRLFRNNSIKRAVERYEQALHAN